MGDSDHERTRRALVLARGEVGRRWAAQVGAAAAAARQAHPTSYAIRDRPAVGWHKHIRRQSYRNGEGLMQLPPPLQLHRCVMNT